MSMRIALDCAALLVLSWPFSVFSGEVVLENDYVRVLRDAVSCAPAAAQRAQCATRVVVALGDAQLLHSGASTSQKLSRGQVAVFGPAQSFAMRPADAFFEVAIKSNHPPARSPGERIAAGKNALLYEDRDFFVFEEKLAPGDTRARHSHSDRVVIQLNRARLQQWPEGEASKFVETVPDGPVFSAPVIHTVKNVGDEPLRGIVIEFIAE